MLLVYLLYIALVLCAITGVTLVVAFVSLLIKKPKYERLFALIAMIPAGISYLIYFYSRIIVSVGTFSDWRVILVTLVYIVSFAISILFFADGKRKLLAH